MYVPALESNYRLLVYRRFLSFIILYGNTGLAQKTLVPRVANATSLSHPPETRLNSQTVPENLLQEFHLGFHNQRLKCH